MSPLPTASPSPLPTFTPGPLKKLFADRHDVRFWETEGLQHTYLFWVRAMLTEEVEAPPFKRALLVATEKVADGAAARGLPDARARCVAFAFLASAWAFPTAELLEALAAPEFPAALSEAWLRLGGRAPEKETVAEWRRLDLESLRETYTRLFYDTCLPFIPPYESVYYNERQVMGKRAAAVVECYRRAGLAAEGEMPDHIQHECEFVAHLAGDEVAASEAGDPVRAAARRETQDEFLRDHLLPWGVKFCADLASLARDPFYATTAQLGNELFNAEWSRTSQSAPTV